MNYQLISERIPNIQAIEQILINRGIDIEDIYHYLNTTDADIISPKYLTNMIQGVKMLVRHINEGNKIFIQVD